MISGVGILNWLIAGCLITYPLILISIAATFSLDDKERSGFRR